MEHSDGAALARALITGFEALTSEVIDELARRGHPGVTATHEFALQAVDGGARDASALGRALGVSKQAAAKTIAALEASGYVERIDDPSDARRRRLRVTDRGREMTAIGAEAYETLRSGLLAEIGAQRVAALEDGLRALAALRLPRGTDHEEEPR